MNDRMIEADLNDWVIEADDNDRVIEATCQMTRGAQA